MPAVTVQDDVIDALLTLWQAATPDVPWDDGYVSSSEAVAVRGMVGGDATGEPDDLSVAATSTQTPAAFEPDVADEDGAVQCAVQGDTGDDMSTSMRDLRVQTRAVLAACDAAVRADPTLGGLVGNAWVESVVTAQSRRRGCTVVRQFTVRFQALQDVP